MQRGYGVGRGGVDGAIYSSSGSSEAGDNGALPAALKAVALAVHLQDMNVVGEAVQQGPGEAFRAEDLGPLVEGKVGGDQDGAPLVALAEDLKKQLGTGAEQEGTKANSSMIGRFGRESWRCKLNRQRLLRRPWGPLATSFFRAPGNSRVNVAVPMGTC